MSFNLDKGETEVSFLSYTSKLRIIIGKGEGERRKKA